jgi:DNA-binding transcriptional LysR family regulator
MVFERIAKTASFAQTARELFLTQSAISHSLRALETSVGCRLIDRSAKKMTLTDAGEALLIHARRMLAEMDAARCSLESLNRWGFQRLRIGCDALVGRTLLAQCLAELNVKNPSLLAEVAHCDAGSVASLLSDESTDVCISELPRAMDALTFVPLIRSSLQLVCTPGHALAEGACDPVEMLPRVPCVLSARSTPSRALVEKYCAEYRITLKPVVEVNDYETLRRILIAGKGVGFLSPWMIAGDLAAGRRVVRDLGSEVLFQQWGLIHRTSTALKPVELEMVHLLTARSHVLATESAA